MSWKIGSPAYLFPGSKLSSHLFQFAKCDVDGLIAEQETSWLIFRSCSIDYRDCCTSRVTCLLAYRIVIGTASSTGRRVVVPDYYFGFI